MHASFAPATDRRYSFFMIRFVRRGCRYTKNLQRITKCSCRFIRDSPDRRIISRNSNRWKTLVFHYLDLCTALGLDRPMLAGASFGGWIAAEWAMRHNNTLRALILIDALGLRVAGAPTPDILSLDAAASRQAIFADPSSALALEVIPGDAETRRDSECSLGPADPGALRLAVSRQPEVTAISLSNSGADLDRLG